MWLLFLVLNFVISWANAWAAGTTWYEADRGWPWLVKWSTAIMSAVGFTWCFLQIVVRVGWSTELLPQKVATGSIALGYVIILVPLLLTGMVITIEAIRQAWRTRRPSAVVVATYDFVAMTHNTYEAIHVLPEVLHSLGDFVGDSWDDEELFGIIGGVLLWVALFIVTLSLGAGILLTKALIKRYERTTVERRAVRMEYYRKRTMSG